MNSSALALWLGCILGRVAGADGGREGLPFFAVGRQRLRVVVVAGALAVPGAARALGIPVLAQPPGAAALQARHLRPAPQHFLIHHLQEQRLPAKTKKRGMYQCMA